MLGITLAKLGLGVAGTVFGIMGVFVGINTALMALMLLLYLVQRPDLPTPYLWGIRLGLAIGALCLLGGIAYLYRAEIVLKVVSVATDLRTRVGPTRDLSWSTGPDPRGRAASERPPNSRGRVARCRAHRREAGPGFLSLRVERNESQIPQPFRSPPGTPEGFGPPTPRFEA